MSPAISFSDEHIESTEVLRRPKPSWSDSKGATESRWTMGTMIDLVEGHGATPIEGDIGQRNRFQEVRSSRLWNRPNEDEGTIGSGRGGESSEEGNSHGEQESEIRYVVVGAAILVASTALTVSAETARAHPRRAAGQDSRGDGLGRPTASPLADPRSSNTWAPSSRDPSRWTRGVSTKLPRGRMTSS